MQLQLLSKEQKFVWSHTSMYMGITLEITTSENLFMIIHPQILAYLLTLT